MITANRIIKTIPGMDVVIRAEDVGTWIANSDSLQQAAILQWWVDAIDGWGPGGSWPFQCREIAEAMDDELCRKVSTVLETLIEHLRAIPMERSQREDSTNV
jgi:hypothetical protein